MHMGYVCMLVYFCLDVCLVFWYLVCKNLFRLLYGS